MRFGCLEPKVQPCQTMQSKCRGLEAQVSKTGPKRPKFQNGSFSSRTGSSTNATNLTTLEGPLRSYVQVKNAPGRFRHCGSLLCAPFSQGV